MNPKRAKLIRKVLRSRNVSPRDATYVVRPRSEREKEFPIPTLNEHGVPVITMVKIKTFTAMLDPSCGRAMYRRLKANLA